ncbi:hypothetical protein [Jidongwangia harbinensis]|uniref:hypothetical protein n=1 Tax=Jidongwangia harbinensis TaxID=2878561 RepID=UPI001CD9E260|nr:hypothetical protein [Jidongwangia harbinensis]MCA2217698.1 hypothetical protein [Jidongwangia harbinensis]
MVNGAVGYEWSPRRHLSATAVLGAVAATAGWLLGQLVFSALAGHLGPPNVVGGVVFVTVYTLTFTAFSVRWTRARPPALRFGAEELELVAERRDAVVVPYAAVSGAAIRWPWPVTMLDVYVDVAAESQVRRIGRGGRRPPRKRKSGRLRFAMPIAGLDGTAADIRSRLRQHGLRESEPPHPG